MEITQFKKNIEKILDDNKAQNITSINLKNKSYIADYMIIASGTSSRHLQSLSEILVNELKKQGIENCRIEGKDSNDLKKWISLHRPFNEVVRFIKFAKNKGYKIGIISTKGKTFTEKILSYLDIHPELIFGYESGPKVKIISNLSLSYDIKGFVEDRRKTLSKILQNNQTKFINCYLAEWGYLKSTDKIDLPQGIKLLKIKNLEDLVAN